MTAQVPNAFPDKAVGGLVSFIEEKKRVKTKKITSF
jgi:hypothetical protein